MDQNGSAILSLIHNGQALVPDDAFRFARMIEAITLGKRWVLRVEEADDALVRGHLRNEPRVAMDFGMAPDEAGSAMHEGEWCFVPADSSFREFRLAWCLGRSAELPHKHWFAFASLDVIRDAIHRDDFRLVGMRLAYQCIKLRGLGVAVTHSYQPFLEGDADTCRLLRQRLERGHDTDDEADEEEDPEPPVYY